MAQLTVALTSESSSYSPGLVESLASSDSVARIIVINPGPDIASKFSRPIADKIDLVSIEPLSGAGTTRLADAIQSEYLMFVMPGEQVDIAPRDVARFISSAEDSGAALVYSDFRDEANGSLADHPLIDHQLGSIRDNFDFGPLFVMSKRAIENAGERFGTADPNLKWAGLYDLRLKLSTDSLLLRIPEALYTRRPIDMRDGSVRQFDYVDPRYIEYQREMEHVATSHLRRIDAYLEPEFEPLPRPSSGGDAARASVVIPVRNRERTIGDAIKSALGQKTTFDFNVIVIDNHSTDQTGTIVRELAGKYKRVVHLVPKRKDLGIGGCWNEAVYSAHCGLYAVQLDSDDLYKDEHSLETIVSRLEEGPYAMVIGAYTIVNFELQEIPPGLIDHREWTRENGRNNALRINGLGAPRAFYVPVLRTIGFPNTSYGEDYAVGLRISRQYEIGRIYESLYFARRWEGNSDAQLDRNTANRYDLYKDRLRTLEILARQQRNRH